MPGLDDQLRALARHLDEHVAPVDLDEILGADTAAQLRRSGSRRRLRIAPVAVTAVILAVAIAGVLTVRASDSSPHIRISAPTTATAPSTTPRTQPCILQHAPGDLYSLAQPTTITPPTGHAIPIVPGNPITRPQSVTLDSDGSTSPGQASNAASLLWGASTPSGPFSGLDHLALGQLITLRQTLRTAAAGSECIQHWRIVRIFTPPVKPWTETTLLRLVGFTPHGQAGPTVQFYVDAVPA
jgi:hypothetical protein